MKTVLLFASLQKAFRGLVVGGCLIVAGIPLSAAVSDSIVGKVLTDPLYIQLYGGINKSANENLPWSEFSAYPWSGGCFVAVGQELTPLWGWRAVVRYNHNKSRNVQRCETSDTWGWNNLGFFGDLTFDLTDGLSFLRSGSSRLFNLKAFAGVGMAYTFGFPEQYPLSYTTAYSSSSRVLPAARAGLSASWRISDNWRLGTELSHTFFADNFNGVKTGAPFDGRTNLKVGVTWLLNKKEKAPRRKVQTDSRLHEIPLLPYCIPDPEGSKHRSVAGRAFLDFPVNETVIYPKYRRNPSELKRIQATVDSALFDKTIQVTRISLHGYASPESPYDNNTRLAKGRTAALKNYLRDRYEVGSELFTTTYTPEDWQNLRAFIEAGNRRRVKDDVWYESAAILETPPMPDEVLAWQSELLEVIDRQMDPDEKELLLKQVGGGKPYRWLLQHVYPGLRHTDYVIEYVVRQYPVKESRKLIYTHPEALSLKEMYEVAQSYTEGSDDWLDAFLIAARQFPDDENANLNAACACVQRKRLLDAKRFLQKAGTSEEAQYVSRVIQAMEGSKGWKMENGRIVWTQKTTEE